MGKMRGRKSKRNSELEQQLVIVLQGGATVADACAYVGIATSTFWRWHEDYQDFQDAIKRARASAKIASVATIRQAAKGNWQAAAWFLERSDPTNWGRKDKVILDVDPSLLKALQNKANEAGVNLSDVFEAMIQEMANVSTDDSAQFAQSGDD